MESVIKSVGLMLGFIVTLCVVGLIISLPIMWLWNGCAVPAISGLHEIGWLQAWGLSILSAFLIKPAATKQQNS